MLSPCLTLYTPMLWWFHLSIQQGLLSIFITHYWIAYLQTWPKKFEAPASRHDGAPLSLYFWNTRLWPPPHHIFLSATLFFAQHITHCFTSLEIHSSWVVRRGSNVILIKASPLPLLFFFSSLNSEHILHTSALLQKLGGHRGSVAGRHARPLIIGQSKVWPRRPLVIWHQFVEKLQISNSTRCEMNRNL